MQKSALYINYNLFVLKKLWVRGISCAHHFPGCAQSHLEWVFCFCLNTDQKLSIMNLYGFWESWPRSLPKITPQLLPVFGIPLRYAILSKLHMHSKLPRKRFGIFFDETYDTFSVQKLSTGCSACWFAQTLCFGYASLYYLNKYEPKESWLESSSLVDTSLA